jgi:hypothetical protein
VTIAFYNIESDMAFLHHGGMGDDDLPVESTTAFFQASSPHSSATHG